MSNIIPAEDLNISSYPPRRVGGQQVGCASNGVRIEHVPSGIVVTVDCAWSQHRNRMIAIAAIEGALTCGDYRP